MMTPPPLAAAMAEFDCDAGDIDHIDTTRGTTYDDGEFDRTYWYVQRSTGNCVGIHHYAHDEHLYPGPMSEASYTPRPPRA